MLKETAVDPYNIESVSEYLETENEEELHYSQ